MKKAVLALVFLASSFSGAEVIGPNQDRILRVVSTGNAPNTISVQDCSAYHPRSINAEKATLDNRCQNLMKAIPLCWIEEHFKKLNYDKSHGEKLMSEYLQLQGRGGDVVGAAVVGSAVSAAVAPVGLFGALFLDFKISKIAKQIFSEVPPLHVLLMTKDFKKPVYFVHYAEFHRQLMDSLWTLYEDQESFKVCAAPSQAQN